MRNKNIPYWAICPITHEIMVDPVIAADGRTYERVAIERLIAKNPRGPVFVPDSNSPLIHSYLIPNYVMLGEIREWFKLHSTLVQEKYKKAWLRLQLLELDELAPWEDVSVALELSSGEGVFSELPKHKRPRLEDVPMENELTELERFQQENLKLSEELARRAASKWSAKKYIEFRLVSTLEGDLHNAADNTIYLDDKHYYIRDPRIGRVRKNPLPAALGVTTDNLPEKLQDLTFQQKLREDIEEKGYFLQQAFFEKMTQGVKHKIVRATVNAEPKLTFSQARNLALAGRPGISEFFQVAIGGAHFMVTKLLDLVRYGLDAEADAIIEQDPGLLDIKEVKFSKLFLHILRFPWSIDQSVDVWEMRKADPDLLRGAELSISQFLMHVSTGDLIETEKMLNQAPTLLFRRGRLVDFGLRRFTKKVEGAEAAGITGLQYADAADDEPMQALLKRYWPKGREEEIDKQLTESRNEQGNNNYKALEELRHSIETLRDVLGVFIKSIARFKRLPISQLAPYEKKKIVALWRKVVEAQLKLPAWVIYLWLEPGENVAWYDASEFGSSEGLVRDGKSFRFLYHVVLIDESRNYGFMRKRMPQQFISPLDDDSLELNDQPRIYLDAGKWDTIQWGFAVRTFGDNDVLEREDIAGIVGDYKKFSQLSAKRAAAHEDYRDDSLPPTTPSNFNG